MKWAACTDAAKTALRIDDNRMDIRMKIAGTPRAHTSSPRNCFNYLTQPIPQKLHTVLLESAFTLQQVDFAHSKHMKS
jgi:hypothetical protein